MLSASPRPWGRWLWWGLSITLGLLVAAVLAIWLGLDPWLRPTTATVANMLPRLILRLARPDLSGVGLLALLRGHTVPLA